MSDYSNFELEGDAKYKAIVRVSFSPVTEVEMTKKYKKGDWRFWKWLWIIPLIPYKVRHDLYTAQNWYGLKSIKGVLEHPYNRFALFAVGDKLFYRGRVKIEYVNGRHDWKEFKSNEEAIKFVDSIKKRCIEVGNELK